MEIFCYYKACLAQRSEHRTCNAMVIGSTPIAGLSLSHYSLFYSIFRTYLTIHLFY